MTRLHTSHTYTCRPSEEAKQARRIARTDVLCVIGAIAVFAGIGVLLAWRG